MLSLVKRFLCYYVFLLSVLKKCPMLKLKCPRGLKEADFLELLKSTFPQLSGDKRFDILTSDERRRLQPVKLKTLTPEGIHGNISCTGWAKSTLYIRLKVCHFLSADALESVSCYWKVYESRPLVFQMVDPRWNPNSLFFQTQKEPQACEEEIYQRKDNNTEDSLSTSGMLTCDETRPQTR